MSDVPEIKDIDTALLIGYVRRMLDSTSAEICDWEYRPVSYINTEVSNLGLHRFQGTARDGAEAHPWSIVLKVVDAPVNDINPTYWNYHHREILAYENGLLSGLPGSIAAPRCLEITKYPGGICWLWLEDIHDAACPTWTLTDYGLVARHLGQFNGAYLTGYPLPSQPWLSRNWMRGWLQHYEAINREIMALMRDEDFWEHPALRPAFRRSIRDDVLRLWETYASLLGTLDRLPQTFCHLDAYRPNLFLRREAGDSYQTVAVDWAFTGIAAVGEEIANLLAASLIWLEYDAVEARSLDEAVFSGYLNGLRDAGWHEDPRLVRLGYTVACALRWGTVGLWWLRSLGEPAKESELEAHWNHPLADLASQWARTTTYILDLAQEAYQLQQDLL